MNKPDLSRVAETFLRVTLDEPSPADWRRYIQMLRTRVTPLVRQLQEQRFIGWFCFLLHGRQSGVPVKDPQDRGAFIHLRVELVQGVTIEQLIQALVGDGPWELTRLSPRLDVEPEPDKFGVQVSALRDGDIAHAWRTLGEASEWSLRMLEAHADGADVPPRNVKQFLHFLCNQVLPWN